MCTYVKGNVRGRRGLKLKKREGSGTKERAKAEIAWKYSLLQLDNSSFLARICSHATIYDGPLDRRVPFSSSLHTDGALRVDS